ncbi:hypothetical protein V6N13_121287 [Hibiscus sabdariffa]
MGGKSSKYTSGERNPTGRSGGSDSWNHHGYPPQDSHYTPEHLYAPPIRGNKIVKYSMLDDDYQTLDQVTAALAHAGLKSSKLILGIDFTKSNEWTGASSFNGKSLHHTGFGLNPYEQAISIIGQTLSAFDDDNLIPCYGFGDASTRDEDVFSFYPGERFCNGFEEVLDRYREIVPHLRLVGPTSFAPIIERAMTVVDQSGGQYHVLLIVTDGQVTRHVDLQPGQLSPQEQKTIDAIVRASEFPLSIVLVGVGDGPWGMMREFRDNIPARAFDNFQFVNFTEIMLKNTHPLRKQAEFALSALKEIPSQYEAIIELGLLGGRGNTSQRVPSPPSMYGASSFYNQNFRSSRFHQDASPYFHSSSFLRDVPLYSGSSSYRHDATPYYGSRSFQQGTSSYSDSSNVCQDTTPYSGSSRFQQNVPPNAGYYSTAATTTGPPSNSIYDAGYYNSYHHDVTPYSGSSNVRQDAPPYSGSSRFQQNVPPNVGYYRTAATTTGPSSSSLHDARYYSNYHHDTTPYSGSSDVRQDASPYSGSNRFQQNVPPINAEYYSIAATNTDSSSSSLYDDRVCPICLDNRKDMAFVLWTSEPNRAFDVRLALLSAALA